ATRDVARRLMIERHADAGRQGQRVEAGASALSDMAVLGTPQERARAYWVMSSYAGPDRAARVAKNAFDDPDPRIREQGVRMIGRDLARNGRVKAATQLAPPAAATHLEVLLPRSNDPDAGVRRELILALRDVPTSQAGD